MVNIKELLDEYNVPYFTEGKNTQRGWINVQCPFCDDHSNHGGFNIAEGYYNCWQCGHHYIEDILTELLECSFSEAKRIMAEHETAAVLGENIRKTPKAKHITFPPGTQEIKKYHWDYLIRRNFDPDEIIKHWHIKGTDHIGKYKFRIIIPIILNNRIVSYTSRDVTGKAELRYKACPIEEEVIHHKHIVYGADYVQNRKAIICEGPTDVWRIGPGAVCTFGTSFKQEQILFLCNLIDEAFILFDDAAKKEAIKLANNLSPLLNRVEILYDYGVKDPGEMSEIKIKKIRKNTLNF